MGIILSTISAFFGIINAFFGIISTLFMLLNILLIGGLIFAAVYIGPKIKSILDGYNAYQSLEKKFLDSSGNKCLTEKELEDFTKKISTAKDTIQQLKKLPMVGGLIPSNVESMIDEIMDNINSIPICQ